MTWKTLISVGRSHRPRVLLTALGLSLVGALAVLRFAPQAALHVAGLAVYGLVLGWMFVGTRLDLRQELGQFAVLKSYPLSGRHVLRGSTLALSLVLSSYALIVMTALVVLSARFPGVVQHWSVRAPLALAILVLSFAASYAMITIGNVLVVMWPAWAIKTLPKDAGFTQVGANLLALLLRMLPFIALWIVPGLVGAFIYFGSVTWLTLAWPWAILCAAPPAAAIVVTEALILLWLAERAYTRLDVSEL